MREESGVNQMNIQTKLAEKREELGPKLPLETPYVLIVDPSSLCNLRCSWCPSGYDELIEKTARKQCVMDYQLFCNIVDSARSFGQPIKTLRLYKEGEPLMNPEFPQMISYAKELGYFGRIDTTTNGVLLNPKLNRRIVDAGLDQINISVNGINAEQINNNTRRKIDFQQYVDNIRDLYEHKGNCTVYVKSIKEILTQEEQALFFDIFGNISDRIFLERLSPAWPCFELEDYGYAYELIGNYGQQLEDRKVCPYLFYTMLINSDGSVSTCIQDWKHLQIVGHVMEDSLKNIWQGGRQKEYQREHLKGNKDIFEMCKKCKVIKYGCYDNIDKYSAEILEKLT